MARKVFFPDELSMRIIVGKKPLLIARLEILGLGIGLLLIFIGTLFYIIDIVFFILGIQRGAQVIELELLAEIIIASGLLLTVVSRALGSGSTWVWVAGLILAGFLLLQAREQNFLAAAIGALLLWYLFRPHVMEHFGIGMQPPT